MKAIVGVVNTDMSFIVPGFTEGEWVYVVSVAVCQQKKKISLV